MTVAQRINDSPDMTVFGITSNGHLWQFGKLQHTTFVSNRSFYTVQQLDQLFAAVNYIFQQCERQLETLVAA